MAGRPQLCKRCQGPLGKGAQAGVCPECIAKLLELKRRRSTRRAAAPPAPTGRSSRRGKAVKAFACVDCGENFFELDLDAGRVVMVNQQPVCAACLKKRRRTGLLPLVSGAGAGMLVLLYLFPLQVLIGIAVMGLGVVAAALYHTKWAATARMAVILAAFTTAAVALIAHGLVKSSILSSADDEVMRPHYADCEKAHRGKDPIQLRDAVARAEESAAKLNYPGRHSGAMARWRKKRDSLLGNADPFGVGLHWYLSSKIPVAERWGRPAIRDAKSEAIEGGKRAVTISMYAPEGYDGPDGWRDAKREIRILLSATIYWNRAIERIMLTLYARSGEKDVVVGRFGIDKEGFSKWVEQTREDNAGERVGAEIFEFCDPREWRP